MRPELASMTVSVTAALREAVLDEADRRHISASDVVAEALALHLGRPELNAPRRRGRPPKRKKPPEPVPA